MWLIKTGENPSRQIRPEIRRQKPFCLTTRCILVRATKQGFTGVVVEFPGKVQLQLAFSALCNRSLKGDYHYGGFCDTFHFVHLYCNRKWGDYPWKCTKILTRKFLNVFKALIITCRDLVRTERLWFYRWRFAGFDGRAKWFHCWHPAKRCWWWLFRKNCPEEYPVATPNCNWWDLVFLVDGSLRLYCALLSNQCLSVPIKIFL